MSKPNPRSVALSLYHFIVVALIATNIRLDRMLMGWDGVYPELNPLLNILRGLSSGWQEYYGAGLVGGHGFAATLPHTILIWLFSLVIPTHLVRQVFIFLCYYLGGLGMFFVTGRFLEVARHRTEQTLDRRAAQKLYEPWLALFASVFYLVNFGTIQVFYVPLEAFTVHFAALPWLTLGALLLFERVSKKRILFFLAISVLSSMQGFIPAVFLSYAATLAIMTVGYYGSKRTKAAFRTCVILWITVIAANAYWLGPVAYFTKTASNDYTSAYNNIVSTPGFIAQSIQYGSFSNVALLRSSLMESVELGGPLLGNWIPHEKMPLVVGMNIFLFVLGILGTIYALSAKRRGLALGFVLAELYVFGNLAVDTPPFSTALRLIQTLSPDIMQAFRTTFTKFGTGYVFYETLFITLGVEVLIILSKRWKRASYIFLFGMLGSMIAITSLPIWNHGLVYPKLFTTLPQEYTQLIRYVNTLPEGKIADFPQDCAEGWYNELWGYFGSGFLWYGINKPVMARAFDVWSKANENYFWELSSVIKTEQFDRLNPIFEKYQVRYILYDPNLTHCRSQKGFTSSREFSNYLASSDSYKLLKEFAGPHVLPIALYERVATQSAVSLGARLPNILPKEQYSDTDIAYRTYGPYITDRKKPADVAVSTVPFSKRGASLLPDFVSPLHPVAVATLSALTDSFSCPSESTTNGFSEVRNLSDSIRVSATNADVCRAITINGINTSHAYALEITGTHILGAQPTLSITNKGRSVGLDIPLALKNTRTSTLYYIPPSFPSEISYTVTIRNTSENRYTTINELSHIRLIAIDAPNVSDLPYDTKTAPLIPIDTVIHPISTLYIAHIPDQKDGSVLVIDEAYDPGWVAFDISGLNIIPQLLPFLFGRFIDAHILVNGWQNGWQVPRNGESTFIIIFLPELLEIAGFAVLGILFYRLLKGPTHKTEASMLEMQEDDY